MVVVVVVGRACAAYWCHLEISDEKLIGCAGRRTEMSFLFQKKNPPSLFKNSLFFTEQAI